MTLRTLVAGIVVTVLAQTVSAQPPVPPPTVRSPEVLPDNRVTFRVSAPAAKAVTLVCECLTLEQIVQRFGAMPPAEPHRGYRQP